LTKFLIGTGGWAYFKVPNISPLVAYSKAFNFVEVNSTFYKLPKINNVMSWRKIVPNDFEFSARCNQKLTHELRFESVPESFDIFDKMVQICNILKAEILHFQTPSSFIHNKINSEKVKNFFSSTKKTDIRFALEPKALNPMSSYFLKTLEDLDIIHSVDLLKGIEPVYQSDILYSRIFGKGYHNVYQPLDNELKQIDEKASKEGIKKSIIIMHSNRMFKDAARFKIYKQSGKFPMVTKTTGIDSLVEVLKEDTKYPSSKMELLKHQGWKIIDLSSTRRIRAFDLLINLPEKTYFGIEDIMTVLEGQNI
jgi:uncharacterized protein YecE (DUF72 family)